ncbi:MAG: isocitrate lyase/phosphoenolpyruvate mutase family protein [Gammaproteobacteria bacterium]
MPDRTTQIFKAETLHRLHQAPPILVLPNAWDAASAAVFERAGARAIATTSAGVANSLGYADGQHAPLDDVLAITARMVAAVRVPLSADMETGYGNTPDELAAVIQRLIETGAVGVNLEDSLPAGSKQPLHEIAEQQERLQAVRRAADALGMPLVINARTDVFLHQVGVPATRLDETLRRLQAYRQAGADCLFVPGIHDAAVIAELVRELKAPLNILAGPETPSVSDLETLGVARVSVGSGLHRASLAFAEQLAGKFLEGGGFKSLACDLTYVQLNDLLSRDHVRY